MSLNTTRGLLLFAFAAAAAPSFAADKPETKKPNIVFIMADDLGYGDLGCYGQQKIHTPNLDRMAKEGMKFTNYYCGAPVCAPSRCSLMTGLHTGHCYVRDNLEHQPEGQEPIPASSVTIAKVLKKEGYATAAIGKWGLGYPGSEGDPNHQGFDLFFGYNCQRHAHNYYPKYLWRNDKKIDLEGNTAGLTGKHYAPDLCNDEALKFIRENKDRPFFLYYPTTVPHVALQVPEDSLAEYVGKWPETPYDGKKGYLKHPTPRAAYAAMITRLDRHVGNILSLLKELKIDDNTLVIFTSDNGPPEDVGGMDVKFFQSAGGLNGFKGDVYEGGIREPFIARWPGKIKPASVSDLPCAAWDMLPTFDEIAGGKFAGETDGLSIAPTLLGRGKQQNHEFLLWEFYGYGGQRGVRLGDWKGVRQNCHKDPNSPLKLYNLKSDPAETTDVAGEHPEIVKHIEEIMTREHRDSPLWKYGPNEKQG
jgi:arylsulfatase A